MSLGADPERLRQHVAALAMPRHPRAAADALRAAEDYVAVELARTGFHVERHPFEFRSNHYYNVVASSGSGPPTAPRVLVGAHFDSVPGTPGADDNASGIAGVLEAARLLAGKTFERTLELVGFNLEEPQGVTYRVGSRAFAADARRRRVRYTGALILEMIGYTDPAPRSQRVPALLFWKRVPRTGTFLAATGDGQSAALLRTFAAASREAVPELDVVMFRTPFRGWLVPHTRLSDNASFWDQGYPALMLTDTAFLRNPHYHTAGDRVATLDFEFMAKVTNAVVAAADRLASSDP